MFVLADWVHNLSPFLLRISGEFGVRWYGLAYFMGFVAAWFVLKKLAERGQFRIPADRVTDLLLWLVFGVMIGGRLGYVLIYQPTLLISFTSGFPFWGVLRINQGGMASHGGLLGVILAAWLFGRKHNTPGLHILDCLALVAPVGLALGRIANFINGELLGRVVAGRHEIGPWWSVRFPQELTERPSELPALSPEELAKLEELIVRSVAAISDPAGGAFGQAAERMVQAAKDQPGTEEQVVQFYPVLIDAIQNGQAQLAQQLGPLLHARHPSQLYQAFFEGPIVLLAVWTCWGLGHRKPGQTGAVFLMAYGVGRIFTEFFRLPDAHLQAARIMGLSRGQWLSAGMILAGAILLTWASRRKPADAPAEPAAAAAAAPETRD